MTGRDGGGGGGGGGEISLKAKVACKYVCKCIIHNLTKFSNNILLIKIC